jgi:hypothetical protein
MAKRFYLQFFIRDEEEPLLYEVRKQEADRLEQNLLAEPGSASFVPFFWFECLDGRSVVINLADVQAARILWEPSPGPGDALRDEDGVLEVKLRGRDDRIRALPDELEQVREMFRDMEMGGRAFVNFMDDDGEMVYITVSEIVWASVPTELLNDEGSRDS